MTDFEARARRFVQANYPQAEAAFLGGSAASGDANDSSDLDVLVVLPARWRDVAFIETVTFEGQLVEAFVYGAAGLQIWLEKGRSESRPVVDRLIAQGLPLIDGDVAQRLASTSREVVAAGPAPCEAVQLDLRRYSLSALVDDLAGAADPGTRTVLMATAWREAAELALVANRNWLGTGKWLLRELRSRPDDFGLVAWADSGGTDADELSSGCRRVLESAGGYLQDGLVRGVKPRDLS